MHCCCEHWRDAFDKLAPGVGIGKNHWALEKRKGAGLGSSSWDLDLFEHNWEVKPGGVDGNMMMGVSRNLYGLFGWWLFREIVVDRNQWREADRQKKYDVLDLAREIYSRSR